MPDIVGVAVQAATEGIMPRRRLRATIPTRTARSPGGSVRQISAGQPIFCYRSRPGKRLSYELPHSSLWTRTRASLGGAARRFRCARSTSAARYSRCSTISSSAVEQRGEERVMTATHQLLFQGSRLDFRTLQRLRRLRARLPGRLARFYLQPYQVFTAELAEPILGRHALFYKHGVRQALCLSGGILSQKTDGAGLRDRHQLVAVAFSYLM